jgi:hypothetical protein
MSCGIVETSGAFPSATEPLFFTAAAPAAACPQAAETAAAQAAASAGSQAEQEALQQRCKELEKKFAAARKKIQVGDDVAAC